MSQKKFKQTQIQLIQKLQQLIRFNFIPKTYFFYTAVKSPSLFLWTSSSKKNINDGNLLSKITLQIANDHILSNLTTNLIVGYECSAI